MEFYVTTWKSFFYKQGCYNMAKMGIGCCGFPVFFIVCIKCNCCVCTVIWAKEKSTEKATFDDNCLFYGIVVFIELHNRTK